MADWEELQALFEAAAQLEGEERAAYLDAVCGEDTVLREELEALLNADAEDTLSPPGGFSDGLKSATSFDDQLEGSQLGAYTLLERIGAGGMGTVFLAERSDGAFERRVAVKVVRRGMDTETVVRRFVAERQILSQLDHPSISALLDGGVTPDGRPYLVMEYVDGLPITEYCDRHRLSIDERLALFKSVCRAVHHAHQNLVVHRDLKPSNILVTEDGTVKLLDFGIAKLLDEDSDAQLTRTGMPAMTPAYASPEQLNHQPVTTVTDVYALGVILYELLTGRRPFEARKSPEELRQEILSGDAPKPSTVITRQPADADGRPERTLEAISASRSVPPGRLRHALAGDLDTICLMAIRPEPQGRYASAEQLADDLDRHRDGQPVRAQNPSVGYRVRKFVRRHRAGVATTAAVVLAFAGVITYYTHRLQEERDTALAQQEKAETVVEFLTNLFFEADPDNSLGEDVTARQILEAGRANIDFDLADQPELQATMKRVLGEVYYEVGNSDVAWELFSDAYDQFRERGGLEAASSRLSLGIIAQDRGDYETAVEAMQYAYDQRVDALGPEHEAVREAVAAQAFLQETLANFDEAGRLHEAAFAMAEALYPQDDVALAQAHSELAGYYRTQDRRPEAEALLRDGIAMMERLQGDRRHPLTAKMIRQLGGTLRNSDRFEESEPLYREAIALQEDMLGPDHYEVAVSWNGYSQLLTNMGRSEEAMEANARMIDIIESRFDGPAPALGAAYNNLAFMLLDLHRYDEALENFDKSLAAQDAIGLPPDHFNRTFPSAGKAQVYLLVDRLDEAEAIFREMLAIRIDNVGEEHRLVQEIHSDLGAVLTEQANFAEAESLLLAAFDYFDRTLDDTAWDRVEAAQRLAALYSAMGEPEQAATYEAIAAPAPGDGEGDTVEGEVAEAT
ncbi:MAG: serine/threonine-protein kinase [Xanthomonadales bacterium]|jgi:serine/threonine-protein kinase|nr:serine/threonine-protein kinase [Xanthomonadales bacterium]